MKFNLLFISGLAVFLLNVIWFEQIRNSRLLKSRLRKKPFFSLYLLLTPAIIILSINQSSFSLFSLVTIALLSVAFAFSHARLAFHYPGTSGVIMPLSFLQIFVGALLFTSTFANLFFS